MVKNQPANAGDTGSISVSERVPGEGNGNLLQYSHLENPMDRKAWCATVYRVTKNQTRLKELSMHSLRLEYSLFEFILIFLECHVYFKVCILFFLIYF